MCNLINIIISFIVKVFSMQWADIGIFQQQILKGCNEGSKETAYRQWIQIMTCQVRKSQFFNSSNRHIRIRLQKWMTELSKYQFNDLWRANKVNYLRLLRQMCASSFLLPPFTLFPKQQLPILQKHQVKNILDILQRQFKIKASIQLSTEIKKYKEVCSKQKKGSEVKMKLSLPVSRSNLVRPSYPKISPATTISSQAWKGTNKRKLPLSKPSVAKLKRQRQYWESNSQIGSGTPKYLQYYIGDVNVVLSEEQENTQRSQPFCDCITFWAASSN